MNSIKVIDTKVEISSEYALRLLDDTNVEIVDSGQSNCTYTASSEEGVVLTTEDGKTDKVFMTYEEADQCSWYIKFRSFSTVSEANEHTCCSLEALNSEGEMILSAYLFVSPFSIDQIAMVVPPTMGA